MLHKSNPVRSKKLRESARGEHCTLRLPGHCNGNPETSVLCHLPHGVRGVGIKASDDHAVIACSGCHDALDKRALVKISQGELYECMVRAMAETHAIWREKELVTYA
ncbi:nuclease domain-containing protein [Spiribacter onubensis]|uniref:Nuclease domain-containing protein n=1 Tax=Spiribacter onubensis TaxID=3122420 RepID=A0ABV3S6U1_9GAMM